jgi:hypothetical protein
MFSSMTRWLRAMNRHLGLISILSGILMLYVSYLLWSDSLALLTTQFVGAQRDGLSGRGADSVLLAGGGNLVGAGTDDES